MIKAIKAQETLRIRHEVMWPNQALDYVKLANDEAGLHYGLFDRNTLVSVVSLFVDGESAQFRKLATLHEHQGKGHGSQLLSHVFEEAADLGVKRLWCNARKNKAHFYQRFGMEETEEVFTKGGIEYVVMEISIGPRDKHLMAEAGF